MWRGSKTCAGTRQEKTRVPNLRWILSNLKIKLFYGSPFLYTSSWRKNIDLVLFESLICRYLRDWCGVGTTYFAMDDETGIGSTQRDPWKWCQETGDKVREKGTIVFIAGPDPGLATNTSIHPNLEHNQVQHRRLYHCQRKTIIRLFWPPATSIRWLGRAGPWWPNLATPVWRHYLRYSTRHYTAIH